MPEQRAAPRKLCGRRGARWRQRAHGVFPARAGSEQARRRAGQGPSEEAPRLIDRSGQREMESEREEGAEPARDAEFLEEQEEAAAREAGRIGGEPGASDPEADEAEHPLAEAGQGEAGG